MSRVFATLVVLLAVTACTSKDGASIIDAGTDALPDAPRACASNADCPEVGTACGYFIADGCAAVGQCVEAGGGAGCATVNLPLWCGCDGKTFPAPCDGYPYGFITTPVAHTGACAGDPVPAEAGADGHIPTCEQVPDNIDACPVEGRKLYYCDVGAHNSPLNCVAAGIDQYECCK